MQDFKKALISTLCGILIFLAASVGFLLITSSHSRNYDWYLRKDLSGTLDFLIAGSSQGQCALYTRQIDEALGVNSYNLGYDSAQNFDKKYLLNKEFGRNDIKTVVLELSYDTMDSPGISDFTDANMFSIMRLDTFSERTSYFFNNVNFDNKLYVYAKLMYSGVFGVVSHQPRYDKEEQSLKGSRLLKTKNYVLTQDEIADAYNSETFSTSSFNEKTIEGFTELISLCKEHGARVIVTVVPVSDNYIWSTDNLDEFNEWAVKYCKENNVEYYDFNLLKDRYTLLSDEDCYSTDTHHMSEKGAKIFTDAFAEVIKEASEGADVSEYFYESFAELKKKSPYNVGILND